MVYDESLATRIKALLRGKKGIVEKKMFGGVAFLLNGNMAVGVNKENLIVRVDANEHDRLLAKKYTRTFDLSGGRPMKGWLLVAPDGVRTAKKLNTWVQLGVDYASSLPRK